MEQPRLTGLEYFWFSRGQLAAARHPMRGTPGPEVAMAVLMEDIIKDARTFADGPKCSLDGDLRLRLSSRGPRTLPLIASECLVVGDPVHGPLPLMLEFGVTTRL